MVDLPEHAAHISIWKHFDSPCYQFAQTYWFDWLTPYLLGYAIVRLVATIVTVTTALKIVLYLVVVATALSFRFLLSQAGRDPWLSLLGFALAFGFTFYWGFLSFYVAIPIAICYLALLYKFSSRPTIALAAILAVLSLVLVASHALLAVYCIAATGVLALLSGSVRRFAIALIPAVTPTVALAWWTIHFRSSDVVSQKAPVWSLGLSRITALPSMLLSGETDPFATAFVGLAIVAILLMRVRLTRDARRWVLIAIAAAAFLFVPSSAMGRSCLFQRSAILVAAGILFVLDEPADRQTMGRGLLLSVVIAWLALLTIRFRDFGVESGDIEPLLANMKTNRRLAYYIAQPYSAAIPGAVYLHFPAYYQERSGGLVSWSFADQAPQLVRYRPGVAPPLAGRPLTNPANIDWRGLAAFDYVLVRAQTDPSAVLARYTPYPLVRALRSGTWWLYETPRARASRESCPPLE